MNRLDLFRHEAINASNESRNPGGNVLVVLPKDYKLILLVVYGAVLALLMILIFGSYTKRVTVSGEIFSTQGPVPVYLPQSGLAKKIFVSESQIVKEMDPLVEISLDTFGVNDRRKLGAIIDFLNRRKIILNKQLDSNTKSFSDKISDVNVRLNSLRREKDIMIYQLGEIQSRSELIQSRLDRYNLAKSAALISGDDIADIEIEALNSRIEFSSVTRQREILDREIEGLLYERDKISNELQNARLEIESELLVLEEQIVNAEAQQGLILKAPISGEITAMQGYLGAHLDSSKPFLFILPSNSTVEARLLVPTSAIGLVKVGDIVHLRYSAYPYQRFGQGRGEITSISGTSLAPNEIAFDSRQAIAEPMFIIKVTVSEASVKRDGIEYELKSGMQFNADILVEKNRIYEWVLSPLYALSERNR